MQRRSYLVAAAAAVSAGLAGCGALSEDPAVDETSTGDGTSPSEADAVDETVYGDGTYPFEADAGDSIDVELNLQEGMVALVAVQGPEDVILEGRTENKDSWGTEVENSGTHRAHISVATGTVDVTVTVN